MPAATVSRAPTGAAAPAGFGRVGFIGLGDMGGPMADNLVAAGFDVTVYDERPAPCEAAAAKGARVAASVAELARDCSIIGVCVWNDEQLEAVALGAGGIAGVDAPGRTLIVHSTVRPGTIERIAHAYAPRAWKVMDAPVSGGRAASLTASLTLMVGAERAVFEHCEPYLRAVGRHVFHVGTRPGMGEVGKLGNNLMALCNAQAVVEAMKLARAWDIPEQTLLDVARVSTGDSWYVRNWGFVDNLLQHHPQQDVMVKDLVEALHAAAQKGTSLPLTQAAAQAGGDTYDERRRLLRERPAGTASTGDAASPQATAQEAIDEALAAWNAAGARWEPEAFLRAYTPDAVFFGGRPGHAVGHAAVRSYFDSYVGVIASAQLRMQDHHCLQAAPDCIVVQGYGCFDMVMADGRAARSVLRGTLALVRRQGRWLIHQHHFSATPDAPPIGA